MGDLQEPSISWESDRTTCVCHNPDTTHKDHNTKPALAACIELPTSNYTQTARKHLKPQDIAKFTEKGKQAIKLQGREVGAHSSSKDCGSASGHFKFYLWTGMLAWLNGIRQLIL